MLEKKIKKEIRDIKNNNGIVIDRRVKWTQKGGIINMLPLGKKIQIDSVRFKLRSTVVVLVFSIFFTGLFSLIVFVFFMDSIDEGLGAVTLPLSASILWYLVLKRMWRKIIFDKRFGIFFGSENDDYMKGVSTKRFVKKSDIYGVQVLSKKTIDGTKTIINYELNIILIDMSRRNIVINKNLSMIRSRANDIALLLDIPIWEFILDNKKQL